jgi:hypothetical protein
VLERISFRIRVRVDYFRVQYDPSEDNFPHD